MKYIVIIALAMVIVGLLLRTPAVQPDIHAELQQRLLEAEMGSATAYHFASGSRAMVPDDTATNALLVKLESSLPESRWQAAKELAVRRDPRAVEAVIRAMRDPKGTIRVCVMASALGHLKDPRALSALTEAVFDPRNRDLRLCAIQSLGMIGDRSAVPTLIAALQANNTPVAAANAIARMGDERGVLPIIAAGSDAQKQLWMVMALGELGSQTALPWLQTIEESQQASVRKAAQEAQWKIALLSATSRVVALANVLATDASASHRMWAAFRLGELKQAQAIPVLMQALEDDNRDVAGRSAAALIRVGDAALPILRAQAQVGSAVVRSYAVAVLGYVGSSVDIDLLQVVVQEAGQGQLADVADRSIDLINRFSRPEGGFTEFAVI
jgi:HEAT repeat protein